MSAEMMLGFEDDQAKAGLCIEERIGDRDADDTSADDRDIVNVVTHGARF